MTKLADEAFSLERTNSAFIDVVELLNKHSLTTSELVVLLGNLMYTIGTSAEGLGSTGPSIDKLEELYLNNPTKLSFGLMYQGYLLLAWYEKYKELLEDSKPRNLALDNKEEKE